MREVEVVDGNVAPVCSLSLFIARESYEGGGEGEEAGKQPRTYPRLFVHVSNRQLRPSPSSPPPPLPRTGPPKIAKACLGALIQQPAELGQES